MNKLFITLIAAFGCSCSRLPQQYSAAPKRCLVQGVATGKGDAFNRFMFGRLVPGEASGVTQVLIRSVDGGEVLWVRGYHLGDKVWLDPGRHKLSVMCETSYPDHKIIKGTDVEIDVKAGYTYYLSANALKSVFDKPHVEIKETNR